MQIRRKKIESIEIHANPKEFAQARLFIEQLLHQENVSKSIATETVFIFEALFNRILNQSYPSDTVLKISSHCSIGSITFKLGFEGKMFIPTKEYEDHLDPEVRILQAFDDKLDYVYKESFNSITLSVKRGFQKSFLYCLASIAAAILVYTFLQMLLDHAVQQKLLLDYVYPVENLFSKATLMIGAPVTFFSFVRNLTNTYIVSERSSLTRKLQSKTLFTSIVAILLAIVAGFFIVRVLLHIIPGFPEYKGTFHFTQGFAEFLDVIMPSNIFEPFMVLSPLPILFLGLICSFAMSKTGKYLHPIKTAIDTCYTFFSKILSVIMFVLPFFCFTAFLDMLLDYGYHVLYNILWVIIFVVLGLIVILLFYLIRLKIAGIQLRSFLKKMPQMIRENIRINSVIDAVPFNARYCARNFGMNRKRLEISLPILAQTNLDGNCFIIMLGTILITYFTNTSFSIGDFVIVALLVLSLSLGAPNQPGSILIGILIIVNYLGFSYYGAVAIYMEVFLGNFQNITNFLGDIVIVAIEEKKAGIPL